MIEIICAIITAAGTVITAYMSKKNKKSIGKWKKESEVFNKQKINNIAIILGELYNLLHILRASRIYIIQPHPLTNTLYISVGIEVVKRGVTKMSYSIKRLPMAETANFCKDLSTKDYQFFNNVDIDCTDKRAKALLSTNGTVQVAIKRLCDKNNNWIGNLCVDSTEAGVLNIECMELIISEAANNIQYILPEYEEV